MSSSYIAQTRRMETIRLPDYYSSVSGTSLEWDDDYGRFSNRNSIFRFGTSREDGVGYNLASKEFYECLDGKRENLGTCFAENLKLLHQRNNPRDRLIACELVNESVQICHCFIVNGNNIIDHSNYRKKNYSLDRYLKSNTILRSVECPTPHLIKDEDIYKAAYGTCLEKGFGVKYLDVNGFTFIHQKGMFSKKDGDWDIAAKKVL